MSEETPKPPMRKGDRYRVRAPYGGWAEGQVMIVSEARAWGGWLGGFRVQLMGQEQRGDLFFEISVTLKTTEAVAAWQEKWELLPRAKRKSPSHRAYGRRVKSRFERVLG
jgi:hypothetical protein